MKLYYTSLNRFEKQTIKKWEKKGFNYHDGHIQLLRYAYLTALFWCNVVQQKVSIEKGREINLKLF